MRALRCRDQGAPRPFMRNKSKGTGDGKESCIGLKESSSCCLWPLRIIKGSEPTIL